MPSSDPIVYAARLREYAARQRARRPLPPREALSPEDEWRCRIIGGGLRRALETDLPDFLRQRRAFQTTHGLPPDPVVVFTSTMPGLVAAAEIGGPDSERFIALREAEFTAWLRRVKTTVGVWYVHHWSYFAARLAPPLSAETSAVAAGIPPSALRTHTVGTLWGPRMGSEVVHLWRWNGEAMRLVAEAWQRRTF